MKIFEEEEVITEAKEKVKEEETEE